MTKVTAQGRQLSRELRLFIVVTLSATAIAWLIVLVARLRGAGSPYQSIWFPVDPWMDYAAFFVAFRLLHTPQFFTLPVYPFAQFPAMVFVYKFFYLFGYFGGFAMYLACALIPSALGLMRLRRALLVRGFRNTGVNGLIATLLISAYPLTFCLQRGNLEVILAVGLGAGMWAYCTGRSMTAAVLWGVFGSAKIYPLLLLALFLTDRKYRELVVAVSSAVLANLLGLIYMGPTMPTALAGTRSGLRAFLGLYALRYDWQSIGYDHSFFSCVKMCLRPSLAQLPSLLHVYMPVMAMGMLALYMLRVRKLSFANRVFFLTVASISIPPSSGDYTLLQLYAPLVILLLLTADGELSSMAPVLCVLALVMTPLNVMFYHGVSLQGPIRSVLLGVLLWMCSRTDFQRACVSEPGTKTLVAEQLARRQPVHP